jgi:hypothetical protein
MAEWCLEITTATASVRAINSKPLADGISAYETQFDVCFRAGSTVVGPHQGNRNMKTPISNNKCKLRKLFYPSSFS